MQQSYLMHDLKGAYTIWYRDVLRFLRDRSRIFGSLAQPLLFLFALGFGLGGALGKIGGSAGIPGLPYIEFLFPGILCMTVLFTALFSAISIVWDREFGFLREVLVAPVSRTAVAIGKVAGGSTVAMFQAAIIMLLGPFLGVHYSLAEDRADAADAAAAGGRHHVAGHPHRGAAEDDGGLPGHHAVHPAADAVPVRRVLPVHRRRRSWPPC